MSEILPSNLEGGITTEVSLTPERLCALGCSDVAPEALEYCLRQGLWQYLLVALDLVREYFASVQACQLRLEQDPETGEAWLVLEVTLQKDVDTLLADYDVYTDRWVAQVPWPACDQIQLVYNVG
jgi:hypothetical protein